MKTFFTLDSDHYTIRDGANIESTDQDINSNDFLDSVGIAVFEVGVFGDSWKEVQESELEYIDSDLQFRVECVDGVCSVVPTVDVWVPIAV